MFQKNPQVSNRQSALNNVFTRFSSITCTCAKETSYKSSEETLSSSISEEEEDDDDPASILGFILFLFLESFLPSDRVARASVELDDESKSMSSNSNFMAAFGLFGVALRLLLSVVFPLLRAKVALLRFGDGEVLSNLFGVMRLVVGIPFRRPTPIVLVLVRRLGKKNK